MTRLSERGSRRAPPSKSAWREQAALARGGVTPTVRGGGSAGSRVTLGNRNKMGGSDVSGGLFVGADSAVTSSGGSGGEQGKGGERPGLLGRVANWFRRVLS